MNLGLGSNKTSINTLMWPMAKAIVVTGVAPHLKPIVKISLLGTKKKNWQQA